MSERLNKLIKKIVAGRKPRSAPAGYEDFRRNKFIDRAKDQEMHKDRRRAFRRWLEEQK